MYASIRRYKVEPKSLDEVIKKVRGSFVTMIDKTPGFISYYVLKSGADEVVFVSVFETQAEVEKANRQEADWIKQSVATLLPHPPEVIVGEAVFQKFRPGHEMHLHT
ncbi:MAG: antibiotic biosynthesis monooxygenase [Chloroflexi bacterium]|nr:antibiotic biosynthesis monooxygenase [Chloroflexota bacterium]